MTLSQRLCDYIERELLNGAPAGSIKPEDSLITRGVLDSIAVLELVTYLEEETGLRIADHEVQLEHFDSVAAMEALVTRLSARARSF